MSRPLIYAELLSNIRQISVIAVLDSFSDSSTGVELAGNGQQFVLRHHGVTTLLDLPGLVASGSRLQRPILGKQELSWRLPLAGPASRPDDINSNEAPWPARDLTEENEFCCRECGAVVLRKGVINTWKDLPSENWAEMMDFWHCHKPDVPETNEHGHSHDDPNANKAYGANARFTARAGVGFVDFTSFLVERPDCNRAEVESFTEQNEKYSKLVCSSCWTCIGHVDHLADGYRLYKWQLKSPKRAPGEIEFYAPSLSSIITAQFQSIMLAQCCSRLVFLPTNWTLSSTQEASLQRTAFLSMWILSPTIRCSSTAQTRRSLKSGTLAMKILWKTITSVEATKLLDSTTHEEVSLPRETIIELERCLRHSASYLPPSGRKFQDWDVGLLERFDAERSN